MSNSKRFNIDDYPGASRTMICRSEYEAESFLRYLDSMGRKWCNGQSYIEVSNFPTQSENPMIGYLFNEGQYSVEVFMREAISDGSALYYSDFFWDCGMDDIDPSDAEELSNFLGQFEVK